MSKKSLAVTNGIVGLVGGIILIFGIIFIAAGAADSAGSASAVAIFLNILKIAILVLGILGAVSFRESEEVGTAPSVLLIVGGALALIPFLGWIGGIIALIGGSLYLGTLRKFNK